MEHEGNMFFREKDWRRTSILQVLLRPEEPSNQFNMRLPPQLEVITRRNDVLAYTKSQANVGVGFQLLPLYDQELNSAYRRKKYSFGLDDALAMRWCSFQKRYPITIEKPVVPKAKDVRFACQKVICPGCTDKLCGRRMVPGPALTESGPLPVPGDVLDRYRKKMEIAKSKRAKKPFK